MSVMITLLIGDNSFETQRALDQIAASFDGVVERIDGAALQLNQLPDILMGISLFATARTIIIRGLSENKVIWPVLADWLSRISGDIHLVLVESKVDKRNAAYKALKKTAIIKEFYAWGEKDVYQAEKWLLSEAKKQGIALNTKCVQLLVSRVGVDQWGLFNAIQKLSLTDIISPETIMDFIDASPAESVFSLLEAATNGDTAKLRSVLLTLEKTEDIFRLTALLFSQVFQLVAVSAAERGDSPIKDFSIHPFVFKKMNSLSKRLGKSKISKIINIFAECDDDMKISRAELWLLLERALMKVSIVSV